MHDNKIDLDSNQFFISLPSNIQETIKQTAIEITSEQQLRQIADNLMQSK